MTCPRAVIPLHDTVTVGLRILKLLDTKYSRSVARLISGKGLAALKTELTMPEFSGPTDLVRRNWLAYNLLRKSLVDTIVPRDERYSKAIAGYLADEEHNAETTRRLSEKSISIENDGLSMLFEAKNIIDQILGDFDWDEFRDECSFSSGSSTRLKRVHGHPFNKMGTSVRDGGKPHVTNRCLPYAIALVKSSPCWTAATIDDCGLNTRDWFEVVPGGKVFAVEKDFDIGRPAEQQPDMNLCLQKGLGRMIRKRLKRVGIDLNDQSRNARWALRASRDDSDVTIDLKSASNSVTRKLVDLCIRPDWAEHLFNTATEYAELPNGTWHKLTMISSMGNGFTFELESLVFYALAKVVCNRLQSKHYSIGIYGDDIIVPKASAGFLVELLEFAGFRINLDKSFMSGLFRESCGLHGYNGSDVTPFRITEPLSTSRTITLANSILEWSDCGGVCDERLKPIWLQLRDSVSVYRGPSYYGDSCLWDPEWTHGKPFSRYVPTTKTVKHTHAARAFALALMDPPQEEVFSRRRLWDVSSTQAIPVSEGHAIHLAFQRRRGKSLQGLINQVPTW